MDKREIKEIVVYIIAAAIVGMLTIWITIELIHWLFPFDPYGRSGSSGTIPEVR